MSMDLGVGEGERGGCDSWLRSELMPYSKGALSLYCTLESGWICRHCSAQLIILLYFCVFVRVLYSN